MKIKEFKKKGYSLLETIRPQIGERKYRELLAEIEFKERMEILNKATAKAIRKASKK